jgi:hypothetical protein
LRWNQIQTLKLPLTLSLFPKTKPVDQAEFSFLVDPAGPARAPFPAQLNRATPSPSLSLSIGARASGYLSSPTQPGHPSQPCAAGRTATARARRGRPDRQAGTHAEPARAPVAHPRGESTGEKTPVPLPVTLQARWRPLRAGHVAEPARAANPGAPGHPCPRTALTARLHHPGTGPSLRQPTRIGVLPLSSVHAADR